VITRCSRRIINICKNKKTTLDELGKEIKPPGNVIDPELKQQYFTTVEECRNHCANRLRRRANQFINKDIDAHKALAKSAECLGRYEGVKRYFEKRFEIPEFQITEISGPGENDLAHDMKITVGEKAVTQEQLDFKAKLDRTLTVIKVVMADRKYYGRSVTGGRSPIRITEEEESVRVRRDDYIRYLASCARAGLQGNNLVLASRSVDLLQSEIVAREAGIVKNRYIRRLGIAALVWVIFLSLAYIGFCVLGTFDKAAGWKALFLGVGGIPYQFRNFLLIGIGAAIGTWLSFSLRKVEITFDDLAALEEDRLNPSVRITFMVALILSVGLLLWTKAVTIEIGRNVVDLEENGTWAILVGLLSGIAERAMATTVARRATAFAASAGAETAPHAVKKVTG
jgi:hypothetical protein